MGYRAPARQLLTGSGGFAGAFGALSPFGVLAGGTGAAAGGAAACAGPGSDFRNVTLP